MPILEVSKKEIEEPIQWPYVIAKIETLMLWPDDAKKRAELYKYILPQALMRVALNGELAMSDFPQKILFEMLEIAINAPSLKSLQADAEKRSRHGSIVGAALSDVLGSEDVFNKKKSIKKSLLLFRNELLPESSDEKYLEDIWRRYRPVAHLWAAQQHLSHSKKAENIEMPFPFSGSLMPDFIAYTNAYLDKGSAYIPYRRRTALLNKDEAWKIVAKGREKNQIILRWEKK